MKTSGALGPAGAMIVAVVCLIALGAPANLAAQPYRVEITPTFGYRWGGTLWADESALPGGDADLESGASYGLMVGFPVSRHLQIELLADHQQTGLRRGRLFTPDELGIDMNVNYYQVGMVWQWNPPHAQPYIGASLGVAALDPDAPGLTSETRFSGSIAGGVKVPVSDTVAFRLELRVFGTNTGSWGCGWSCDNHWWNWCDGHDCDWGDRDLTQAALRVGVTFAL